MSKEKFEARKDLPPRYKYLNEFVHHLRMLNFCVYALRNADPEGEAHVFMQIIFDHNTMMRKEALPALKNLIKEGRTEYNCSIARKARPIIRVVDSLSGFGLDMLKSDYGRKIIFRNCSWMNLYLKDLFLIEEEIEIEMEDVVDSGEVVLESLRGKKKLAEGLVEGIIDERPDISWTLQKLESALKGRGYQYSHVSIGKLKAWEEYNEKNPRRKPDVMELTDRRLDVIDSEGNTYFSRNKRASNFCQEDEES